METIEDMINQRDDFRAQVSATYDEEKRIVEQIRQHRFELQQKIDVVETQLRQQCKHEWIDMYREDFYRNNICAKCGILEYKD